MSDLQLYFQQIKLPEPGSHKGQNGKLLIIGGSELFHAASKWSLDMASKFVDMVFYASIPSNNELIKTAKGEFWNGIVIDRADLDSYAEEADCILIGPGMVRSTDTERITNNLLKKYPAKKWVIDAGALQMVDPALITAATIITPHQGELEKIAGKVGVTEVKKLSELSQKLQGACILVKGVVDVVVQDETVVEVTGGNAGMTKGGTGDVLAGIVAGLYACNDQLVSAVVASHLNKAAGDSLYQTVGPNFNASDLVNEVPTILWQHLKDRA